MDSALSRKQRVERAEGIVKTHLVTVCEQLLLTGATGAASSILRAKIIPTDAEHKQCSHHGEEVTGGDMNHIQRVCVTVEYYHNGECSQMQVFSVIVKLAPQYVLFLLEISGEKAAVDFKKVAVEFSALRKCNEICPGSVPRPFALDQPNKALILEDLSHYRKLSELLKSSVEANHVSVTVAIMKFIGLVHKTTWIESLPLNEKDPLLKEFRNENMKTLMADFLFQRPYNTDAKSNQCNPLLEQDIIAVRGDCAIRRRVEGLKQVFLEQHDCLCHGDLSCDNVLVRGSDFKVLDFEFSSIGLRAYDIALFLETILYHAFCHQFNGNAAAKGILVEAVLRGIDAYSESCGLDRATDHSFVGQVCGLIGCELLWRVLGSANTDDFDGNVGAEQTLLSMAKGFLISSVPSEGISGNIQRHFRTHNAV